MKLWLYIILVRWLSRKILKSTRKTRRLASNQAMNCAEKENQQICEYFSLIRKEIQTRLFTFDEWHVIFRSMTGFLRDNNLDLYLIDIDKIKKINCRISIEENVMFGYSYQILRSTMLCGSSFIIKYSRWFIQ